MNGDLKKCLPGAPYSLRKKQTICAIIYGGDTSPKTGRGSINPQILPPDVVKMSKLSKRKCTVPYGAKSKKVHKSETSVICSLSAATKYFSYINTFTCH